MDGGCTAGPGIPALALLPFAFFRSRSPTPGIPPPNPLAMATMLPRPRSTVLFRELPEGAILFSTDSETYFSLNTVGARVWRLLPPACSTRAEIVDSLTREHPDVAAEVLTRDVNRLLQELEEHALLETPREC